MLHDSRTDFSNPDESFSLPATSPSFATGSEAITVSAVHSVPLHESAMPAGPEPYSGADMAVMAVALVGAALVMLGWAMLAKRPLRLAQQH